LWKAKEFLAARSSSPEGEPARAKLLNIAAKVARREYLPSLEKCRTINDAHVEVGRYDKYHATLAMDLKAVFDEFRPAAPSREWIKRAAEEICNAGLCGPYSFVEEILTRHAVEGRE
jgi:hypothetical protein